MSTVKFTVSALAVIAASATTAAARDQIQISGSSTVLPYSTIVAEVFGEKMDFPVPVVESGGTGSGLQKFCEGVGANTIDIANANRAASDLALTDDALSSFANYITRATELTTQAANGTLTAAQRAGIGTELSQIHGNLVALANARDSSGHALFGGETPGAAYTLDGAGNAIYSGTASAGELALGDGQAVARIGEAIFGIAAARRQRADLLADEFGRGARAGRDDGAGHFVADPLVLGGEGD